MRKTKTWTLALAAALAVGGALAAADGSQPAAMDHSNMGGMDMGAMDHSKMAQPGAADALTAGEVRKVDAEQGKVTIKHEAIANLDMPPMTMVFRADKPELIAGLKPGDRIRFRAESAGGAISVTRVEKAN